MLEKPVAYLKIPGEREKKTVSKLEIVTLVFQGGL